MNKICRYTTQNNDFFGLVKHITSILKTKKLSYHYPEEELHTNAEGNQDTISFNENFYMISFS